MSTAWDEHAVSTTIPETFPSNGSIRYQASLHHPNDEYGEDHRSRMRPRTAGSRPTLSTIAIPTLRDAGFAPEVRPLAATSRRIPEAEKNVDDPTTSPPGLHTSGGGNTNPPAALSNLFVVHNSPESSRNPSYLRSAQHSFTHARHVGPPMEAPSLPDHLYTRGLLEGRHSDITVVAFGCRYKLHRLILDRAPFFASALSEPWLSPHAHEIAIHPEDMDSSITQASFELALRRLYGLGPSGEEDMHAINLFATGCWLEMHDLVHFSIESILRHMTMANLGSTIRFVTSNCYGRAGEKLLASAKAMLCRNGWKMPLSLWDNIPAEIIREIVGGDGFFVNGEWERWLLAKRLVNRRLTNLAAAKGIINATQSSSMEDPYRLVSSSTSTTQNDNIGPRNDRTCPKGESDIPKASAALYTHGDIEPILILLDEGIHYSHLNFEQLQYVRAARDCMGLPIIPEKVICNALWQQMELRQKVMNARPGDAVLGLSEEYAHPPSPNATSRNDTGSSHSLPTSPKSPTVSKVTDFVEDDNDEVYSRGTFEPSHSHPRKFWIPNSDRHIVMGGNAEPVVAMLSTTKTQSHSGQATSTVQREDTEQSSDFVAGTAGQRPPPASEQSAMNGKVLPARHTQFPPFRFAVEFPNPRQLKERKRSYSRTIFYAGSFWNVYIQKVTSTRSKQLGVYLHRVKERAVEEVLAGTNLTTQGNVDERIGQLEREISTGQDCHRNHWTSSLFSADADDFEENTAIIYSPNGSAQRMTSHHLEESVAGGNSSRSNTMRNLISRRSNRRHGNREAALTAGDHDIAVLPDEPHNLFERTTSDDERDEDHLEAELHVSSLNLTRVPTIPPYIDARPNVRAYFKIYSPSRHGRMLSVYEAVPSDFDFTQSWGWCSSSLMLDDGPLLGQDDPLGPLAEPSTSTESDSLRISEFIGAINEDPDFGTKIAGDGKLRFVVVIGSI